MGRMVAKIEDPMNIYSYEGWPIALILYSFLVDDVEYYDRNPGDRRLQLKEAILKSEEFKCVQEGGRLVGGHARPYNPYTTNLGVRT